jgi:hypothetical protein
MEATASKKMSRTTKIALIAFFILLFILLMLWIYKNYFEFNNQLINSYMEREASRYSESAEAKKFIQEGVESILKNKDYVDQVKLYAKKTGLDKEKVLVDAAIAQCKSFQYLA